MWLSPQWLLLCGAAGIAPSWRNRAAPTRLWFITKIAAFVVKMEHSGPRTGVGMFFKKIILYLTVIFL